MANFEPTAGYSSNRTSTVFSNGTDNQRAEFAYSLGNGWIPSEFSEDKTSVLCTNGSDVQRAVVTFDLNGTGGGTGGDGFLEQFKTMPTASLEYKDRIVEYIGLINTSYTNGYIYKCIDNSTYTSTVTWTPAKISISGDNFATFLKTNFPDRFMSIVSGTMEWDGAPPSDLWFFKGKNADGEIIATYQHYTEDMEAMGFSFTDPIPHEIINFECEVTLVTESCEWTRINVQPTGGSGSGSYNDLTNRPSINGVTLTGNKTTTDLNIIPNATFTGLGLAVSGVTAKQLVTSLVAKNLPSGSFISGGVALTDFPSASLSNAELIISIKDSTLSGVKVYDLTLSSTTTAPYIWYADYRTDMPSADITWVSGGSGSGANTDLSNLSATGESHFLKSTSLKTVNGMNLVGTGNVPTFTPLPDDMWSPERTETGRVFNTTDELCSYLIENHPELLVRGNCYLGTCKILDGPTLDKGGDLVIKIFGDDLFQLDIYSTNTKPAHHWYTMYFGSLEFPWVSTQENDLPTVSTSSIDMMSRIVDNHSIIQYTGNTDETFTHGCFYECEQSGFQNFECEQTAGVDVGYIDFDEHIFKTKMNPKVTKLYVFRATGIEGAPAEGWTLDGIAITGSIADYGINIDNTVYTGVVIQVSFTAPNFTWNQVNVGAGVNYTAGDGINISGNTISNTGLINTATFVNSLNILGTDSGPSSMAIGEGSNAGSYSIALGRNAITGENADYSVVIGYNAQITPNGEHAIALGNNTQAGTNSISIGESSMAGMTNSISIGKEAVTGASYAIQIGRGTNNNANTLSVGLDNSNNYQLLNSSGIIPKERISTDFLKDISGYDATKTQVLKNINGTFTWVNE